MIMKILPILRAAGLMLLLFGAALPLRAFAADQPKAIARGDDAAFERLIAAAKESMPIDPSRAREQAYAAEKLVRDNAQIEDRLIALATAEWLQAEALLRLNDIQRAKPLIERAQQAVNRSGKVTKLNGGILLTLGGIHNAIPDVAAALADYHGAYRVFRSLHDSRSETVALLCLSMLYVEADDNLTALRYSSQALETYRADPSLLLAIYNNRALALMNLKRFDQAAAQFQQALELAKQNGNLSQQARILRNIARIELETDALEKADQAIAEGLALARAADDRSARLQFLNVSALVAVKRGQYQHAERLVEEALAGVDPTQTTLDYHEAHKAAYLVYKKLGKNRLALENLEALKRLDDESAKLAASTNTSLMAARFDYANQNLKIANLKADELRRKIAYERSEARMERIIFVGAALAALIVVVLLVIGILAIRRSRNQVRAANVDLAESNTALAKALAAKTEFLATTSHEIRTPLNGILGMTQVMLADRGLAPATRERIQVVHGAGVTMRALVDDILDVAKMETGNMMIEHVEMDVCAVLADVARMWEEQAEAKGIAFGLDLRDCPALIMGDAARLRQIVFNLLANALKFTAAGRIDLHACAVDADGERRMRIGVSDTGIGIEPDKLDAIFESFRQADTSTTRRFGGTGLGLAICRKLARAMGGEVHVESVVGEGATFTIDLPLIEAESRVADDQPHDATRGLLIVERNPIIRSMMKALFEPCMPWVEAAESMADAHRLLTTRPVALAIVDDGTAIIDGKDGVEAMKAFATAAVSCQTKTVLLRHATGDTHEQARASGIDLVIDKPIAGADLRTRLFPELGLSATACREDDLVSRAA